MTRIRKEILFGWCLVLAVKIHDVSSTTCAIDTTLPETAAGNSYECPDTLDDGTENEFNQCCYNDRPDESGNFHSCCQDEAEKSAQKMQEFYNICIIIGAVTGCCMAAVFMCTYCEEDTFPCLKKLKRTCRKYYNLFMDGICFCSCLPKKLRRKEHKDGPMETNTRNKRIFDKPPSADDQELVVDPFWA
ncbi:uncharacterized protein LOC121416599 [Lytechinus variegatus]|uniref:uncharacterized protein LOC121416599 n=1 Tax=Lytechinus variegatus TaxID=7654 RepID=UPI001BB2C056|nr:uncharacterized protein LOC121416599 [Lytechinus variegatus]